MIHPYVFIGLPQVRERIQEQSVKVTKEDCILNFLKSGGKTTGEIKTHLNSIQSELFNVDVRVTLYLLRKKGLIISFKKSGVTIHLRIDEEKDEGKAKVWFWKLKGIECDKILKKEKITVHSSKLTASQIIKLYYKYR